MKILEIFLILSLFGFNSSWRIFNRRKSNSDYFQNAKMPEEFYFKQKLDHFNPSNTQTWNQRYYEKTDFYRDGGPLFLMIGGESETSGIWLSLGSWLDFAEKYNAHCILLEHRFYGKSRPTEDLSVKNLSYLTSEQALADIAWFITSYNEKGNFSVNPKWIVFGGSYSGSLAAWMRLKYPHLVLGAVSSSGPLLALADFKDYYKVVHDSLYAYSPKCVTNIEKGTQEILSLVLHPLGQQSVSKLFKLCVPLELNNEKDFSTFMESLASNFAEIVQYNGDNRHTNKKMANITIDHACHIMLDEGTGPEIDRLAKINSEVLAAVGEKCLEHKYDKMIEELRDTKWGTEASNGSRQWTYQTCTEFGFFQTSTLNETKKMFGDKFPLEYFLDMCTDVYGTKFNSALLSDGLKTTNANYGALNNQASNVVYVHGTLDPWHVLGITRTLVQGAPAILINGTAHCADTYSTSPLDPPQLTAARKKIEKLIGIWLKQLS